MQLTTLVNDDYVKICKIIKVIISRKNNPLSPECGIMYVEKSIWTLSFEVFTQ